jgi:hypothetical protein
MFGQSKSLGQTTSSNGTTRSSDENKVPAVKQYLGTGRTAQNTLGTSTSTTNPQARTAFNEITNTRKQGTTKSAKPSASGSFLGQQQTQNSSTVTANNQNVMPNQSIALSKAISNSHSTIDGPPTKVHITEAATSSILTSSTTTAAGVFGGHTLTELPNVSKTAFEFHLAPSANPNRASTSDEMHKDPMEVDSNQQMMLSPRVFVPTEPIEDIDANEFSPQFCSDYVQYIFSYLKKKEVRFLCLFICACVCIAACGLLLLAFFFISGVDVGQSCSGLHEPTDGNQRGTQNHID